MRMRVRSLALLSGLRIWCCHELWFRSQRRFGSRVAMAVAYVGQQLLIRPLAWELLYVISVALESQDVLSWLTGNESD